MSNFSGYAAQQAYERGEHPIDVAEKHVTTIAEVHLMVAAARATEPAAFPGYVIELTPGALARRILAELLDIGWTAPEVTSHDPR